MKGITNPSVKYLYTLMGSKSKQKDVIPSIRPHISVVKAPAPVPLLENTPNKKTQATGGAKATEIC